MCGDTLKVDDVSLINLSRISLTPRDVRDVPLKFKNTLSLSRLSLFESNTGLALKR